MFAIFTSLPDAASREVTPLSIELSNLLLFGLLITNKIRSEISFILLESLIISKEVIAGITPIAPTFLDTTRLQPQINDSITDNPKDSEEDA